MLLFSLLGPLINIEKALNKHITECGCSSGKLGYLRQNRTQDKIFFKKSKILNILNFEFCLSFKSASG